jgi:RHS repeat-associated protein
VEYTFSYDSTGNRQSKKVGTAAQQNYTYPTTNHRLTNDSTFARTYDANGNTTRSATAKFFTYDQRNRLIDFRTGSASSTIVSQYQYNAKGERTRKCKGTVDQARYLFNEAGQLLTEETISGTTTTTTDIIWLDGIPIGAVRGGVLYAIEADHLGTPRNLYDFATKTKIWTWPLGADAFGETQPNQDPDANGTAFVFNMRFPGQLFDAESGLNYNYFRDYDPVTGRYVQSDPIGLAGGISTYGYAGLSPLIYSDSYGLDFSGYVQCVYQSMMGGYERDCGGLITKSSLHQSYLAYKNAPENLAIASGVTAKRVGKTACAAPVCTLVCGVGNFIGYTGNEALQSFAEDQVISNSDKIASKTNVVVANQAWKVTNRSTAMTLGAGAKKLVGKSLPGYGWYSNAKDGFMTVGCSVKCGMDTFDTSPLPLVMRK